MALAHAGLGWAIGVVSPSSDRRLRIACAAAALLPEIDRLTGGRLALGHNIFAGLFCVAVAAWFFRNHPDRAWLGAIGLIGLSFGLHLVLDAMLSGTELRLFWPLSGRGRRFSPLVPSMVTTVLAWLFVALPWALAFWKQVTPLEIVSERLDLLFQNLFRGRNRDCQVCGKGCNNRCSKCRKPVCFKHAKLGSGFRLTCTRCRTGTGPKTSVPAGVEDYVARVYIPGYSGR